MVETKLIYDKTVKSIIIPNGVTTIDDETFMDFEELEEIIIPDSVEYIGKGAFKGCKKLKKVKLPSNLHILDDFAFSECVSLEEITIPASLHYFSYGVFSHCHNLKTVHTHNEINYIDDIAFYNCRKLENFDIPSNVTSIGRMALMGCESIKHITIPDKLDCIECGALSLMSSLEQITVDDRNKKFFAAEDDTLLVSRDGIIIQYAIASTKEEMVVGYFVQDYKHITNVSIDGQTFPIQSYQLVYNIADYAFAGAKNLKRFSIPAELESIGGQTFSGCEKLKDLEVFHTDYGNAFLLHIHKSPNEEASIPFENIVIGDGIQTLCGKLEDLFKNARNVTFPDSLEQISEDVFTKSKYLTNLKIPSNIKMIFPHTFYPEINVDFPSFGTIKAKDFNLLQMKTSEDYYLNDYGKYNIRIFSLKDGTYYVRIDDFDTVKINRDEIIKLSNTSHVLADNPDDFVMYIIDLMFINAESSRLLQNIWTDPNLQATFHKFVSDCGYIEEIASKKISRAIREILDNGGKYDEFLFTGTLMKKFNKEELIKLLSNYNQSMNRFFRLNEMRYSQNIDIVVDKLIKYCGLLEKYHRQERFLYNPIFFEKLSFENQELLVKYLNKNIKHLLVNSQTLHDIYGANLNDLLNLCNALGIFGDEERVSQRMCTFLNERMVSKDCSNPINGNDIHTMFGEIVPREDVDYEFIMFFVENYEKLIELEKNSSGIIARIYNNFRDISKTSTSHRGSQRHLKVTLEKCQDYLLSIKFEGVTEENKALAYLLQKYYSEPYALNVGEMLIKQSKKAPRNIYSKINFDTDGKPIYSYDSSEDLAENYDKDFSYQWLPKQSYDNLILGKYCNCCAHILGAGAGIMRASMILDSCQNLVIRNHGEIIAKMTIYVNREQGYAVFNTAEVNVNYRSKDDLNGIYEAFMRGVNAFVDKYNENNVIPISIVSIGEYRNTIREQLGNIDTELLETPSYSTYGYNAGDQSVGTYDGDAKGKQLLVLLK